MRHRRLRKYLPEPEAVLAKPWARPFRRWLSHPGLWHLSRRSVPSAIAIGLFCGLIPGPFQMLGALILAIPLRANIPLAMATTVYTNPLTIVPLYVLAYGYGRLLLGQDGQPAELPPFSWHGSVHEAVQWLHGVGKPLGVGLIALAVTLAVVGYFVARIAWRAYVVAAWRRRRRRTRQPS